MMYQFSSSAVDSARHEASYRPCILARAQSDSRPSQPHTLVAPSVHLFSFSFCFALHVLQGASRTVQCWEAPEWDWIGMS
jgi:hypothetical protein